MASSTCCASSAPNRWKSSCCAAGRLPLPPYIQRARAWTTTSATRPCSRANWARWRHPPPACTSTMPCWRRCAHAASSSATVTLHVGAGTFQPMRAEHHDQHVMHSEWLNVGAELVRADRRNPGPRQTRDRGRHHRGAGAGSELARWCGAAVRGRNPVVHLPGASHPLGRRHADQLPPARIHLLMLVCAFAGKERVLAAYRHAVARATASSATAMRCWCFRKRTPWHEPDAFRLAGKRWQCPSRASHLPARSGNAHLHAGTGYRRGRSFPRG
jgi:hypothetical protein